MKKNIVFYLVAVALLLVIISCQGCNGLAPIADAITKPSARDLYARQYRDSAVVFEPWQAAYNIGSLDSLEINMPYGEKGIFSREANAVYTYIVSMREGEILRAAVDKYSFDEKVFIEILQEKDSVWNQVAENRQLESNIEYPVDVTARYKIILQPEINATGGFFININKRPQYGFPVLGKGNNAIGSFWGMERDGGKRRHEGIDIFAPKGTPVIAVTKGFISYTGERGIGGKQVWLRDGIFGKSLYYAHLDSIAVVSGSNVMPGDTLGFVGNTGNARFTPSHLHFGIYRNGAIDPLPFVYRTSEVDKDTYKYMYRSNAEAMVKSAANLRLSPAATSKKVGNVAKNEKIRLLGQHKNWLHIKTDSGIKAFIHADLVRNL